MANEFTYKITEEPTKETIQLECPSCKTVLNRYYPIGTKEGISRCNLCECEFEWERK